MANVTKVILGLNTDHTVLREISPKVIHSCTAWHGKLPSVTCEPSHKVKGYFYLTFKGKMILIILKIQNDPLLAHLFGSKLMICHWCRRQKPIVMGANDVFIWPEINLWMTTLKPQIWVHLSRQYNCWSRRCSWGNTAPTIYSFST